MKGRSAVPRDVRGQEGRYLVVRLNVQLDLLPRKGADSAGWLAVLDRCGGVEEGGLDLHGCSAESSWMVGWV